MMYQYIYCLSFTIVNGLFGLSKPKKFPYIIDSVIKKGGHGIVFKGRSKFDTKQFVAIKAEDSKKFDYLERENKIYSDLEGRKGFPKIFWFGVTTINYTKLKKVKSNVLVMELLGPDIESLLDKADGNFSLKTVLMLVEQFLNRVEYLHSKNYIHQDLKPENFLMGVGESEGLVYLADFGVTKRYNPTT